MCFLHNEWVPSVGKFWAFVERGLGKINNFWGALVMDESTIFSGC